MLKKIDNVMNYILAIALIIAGLWKLWTMPAAGAFFILAFVFNIIVHVIAKRIENNEERNDC